MPDLRLKRDPIVAAYPSTFQVVLRPGAALLSNDGRTSVRCELSCRPSASPAGFDATLRTLYLCAFRSPFQIDHFMARKLKTYKTSIGFFDLVIAAPSMKAALEAWGSNSNLFNQGFAHEVDDEDTVAAALKMPGVILRRPVGTNGPFTEHPGLPADLPRSNSNGKTRKQPTKNTESKPAKEGDDHAARKAALAVEQEEERRESERRKAEAAEAKQRARRELAVDKAQDAIYAAEQQHEELASAIEEDRRVVEAKAKREDERWTRQKLRLAAALERAEKLS